MRSIETHAASGRLQVLSLAVSLLVATAGLVAIAGCDQPVPPLQRFISDEPTQIVVAGDDSFVGVRGAVKADLAGDVRDAWVVPAGEPFLWDPQVGSGAVLRFAYALAEGASGSFRFQVRQHGDESPALFSGTLDADAGEADGWHDARIRLPAPIDRRLHLSFEVSSEDAGADGRSLALWATPTIEHARSQAPPNVVLIVLDTLRADHLSCYGYEFATSPRIDAWAQSSVRFEQAVAPAPWTLPSHASLFSGLDPLRHGVNHNEAMPASMTTLAEELRGQGYRTAAITGGAYLRPRYGFHQGFERFFYEPRARSENELATHTEDALAWLQQHRDVPFFFFFHTYEIHYPYRERQPWFDQLLPPDAPTRGGELEFVMQRHPLGSDQLQVKGDYLELRSPDGTATRELSEDALELLRARYDSGIAHTDDHVGRILELLREIDRERDTLVVLTSDHGEALGEQERAGHGYLADYNLMVPLIISLPGQVRAGPADGRSVETQVSLVDLMPTILELTRSPAPAEPLDGSSLVPLLTGDGGEQSRVAWSYASSGNNGLARRGDGDKIIYQNSAYPPLAGRAERFDLVDDRAEVNPLGKVDPKVLTEIRRRIEAKHQGLQIALRNRGSTSFRGSVQMASLNRAKVKVVGPPCSCVTFAGDRRIALDLAPGDAVTLLLEGGPAQSLELELESLGPGAARVRELISLADIGTGRSLQLANGRWTSGDDGRVVPEVGLRIWRTGPHVPLQARDATPEQRMQLEALGYIW
jgi:arylsulfatase A-like enzyme